MIANAQQCIDFITGSDFPLPEELTAFEKPWTESPYYWSYRNKWPGMNYRIEIEPGESSMQVRFYVEQDLIDNVWKDFQTGLKDSETLIESAPGVVVDKNAAVLEYPCSKEIVVKQMQNLMYIFDELWKLRGL